MNVAPIALASVLLFVTSGANAQENGARSDALALDRLELRPYAGWAFVPNSVTGPFAGADVTFRLSPAIALGIDAAAYSPFDRSPGTNPSYPLNETRDSFDLDVAVFPWPAQVRRGLAAGAFEPYLLATAGALQSRPVPVVDPADRSFDYNTLVDLGFGAGVRVFATGGVAFTLELRDLLYFEKVENPRVPTGSPSEPLSDAMNPRNPSTWYDANTHVTNAIQLRLGASFFVLGR